MILLLLLLMIMIVIVIIVMIVILVMIRIVMLIIIMMIPMVIMMIIMHPWGVGNLASRALVIFCAASARIRRLRKSPQYPFGHFTGEATAPQISAELPQRSRREPTENRVYTPPARGGASVLVLKSRLANFPRRGRLHPPRGGCALRGD